MMNEILYKDLTHQIEIVKEFRSDSPYLAYYKNGYLYSGVYPEEPLRSSFSLVSTVFTIINNAKKVLILGMGLGSVILQIKALLPNCRVTAVDIDGQAFELAQNYFGLAVLTGITYFKDDALEFLNRTQEKYDYILVDIFNDDEIPPAFTTVSFFQSVERHLTDRGIITYNSNMRNLELMQSFSKQENPLAFIHKRMLKAGFSRVFQNDLHDGGWVYGFKSPVSTRQLLDKMKKASDASDSLYVKRTLLCTAIFLKEMAPSLPATPDVPMNIIEAYRNYVFLSLMQMMRNTSIETAPDQTPYLLLARKFITNKLKTDEISVLLGKSILRCPEQLYYRELDKMIHLHKQLIRSIHYIMIPESLETIRFPGEDSFLLRLLHVITCTLEDRAAEEILLDSDIYSVWDYCKELAEEEWENNCVSN